MAFPGTYNFDYYRGDTFQFVITPKTSTGATFQLDAYSAAGATFTISTSRGDNPTTKISNVANSSMLAAIINTTTSGKMSTCCASYIDSYCNLSS